MIFSFVYKKNYENFCREIILFMRSNFLFRKIERLSRKEGSKLLNIIVIARNYVLITFLGLKGSDEKRWNPRLLNSLAKKKGGKGF